MHELVTNNYVCFYITVYVLFHGPPEQYTTHLLEKLAYVQKEGNMYEISFAVFVDHVENTTSSSTILKFIQE